MSTSNQTVGRTEQLGLTSSPTVPIITGAPPLSTIMAQLEHLTTMMNDMKSRMDSGDPYSGGIPVTGRPPPAPPFSRPIVSAGHSSLPMFTFQPTPTVGMQISLPLSTIPATSTMPPFGYSDATSMATGPSHHQHTSNRSWQNGLDMGRDPDRQPLRRPQMVSPTSCWGPPNQRPQFGTQNQDQHQQHRVKMVPPRFDGTEVNNWIRGVQFYFDHVGTPEAQRLHYVIMLFEPEVADWIWNYCSSHEYVTWFEFLDDVRRRFDPQCYTSHIGLMKRLQQTGTVSDDQLAFKKLQNNAVGVPDHVLLDLYVAGLKQPLQDEVILHQPQTLASAFAMAVQIAACRPDLSSPQSGFQRRPWQQRESRSPALSSPTPASSQASPAVATHPTHIAPRPEGSKTPIVRLTAAQKAERARLQLCYYCPERWVAGHVCKNRVLAYMGVEDDEDDPLDDSGPTAPDEVVAADLSHLHSMDGKRRSKSITLSGSIGSAAVAVLVDTGSSHDFLHPRIAEKLHLPLTEVKPFRVYVGNGEALLCSHLSKDTHLIMQGKSFSVDLHILPVHGPDVILGMDWLESLGRVTTDYVQKSMEFFRGDDFITLQGMTPQPKRLSLGSLASLVSRASLFELYELVPAPQEGDPPDSPATMEFPSTLPDGIQRVLQEYVAVFQLPTGLPPARQFDHRIHLLPNSKPVNVRPYRYPYFQKTEIESQVQEMLDQGVIQRSQSPFSSPVLLLRKKDGTFRFCIDYRALNKATVPDHFPIPTADELFDELGDARFFTKLDLRSGYHQIRMHESDVYKTAFRTHDGHFEFLVMPFGLTNAPSTFQSAMNCIFRPFLRKSVIVFFDDILIYSPSLEAHVDHLGQVLSILQDQKFFVKLSKCSFCSTTVDYLGHIISAGQLKADPSKIEAMEAWPIPTTVKQLRGFLGLTGYYRRFISHYAEIASPLTDLLKKDAFCWSQEATDSFAALKHAMTAAPVLRLPDFSKTFFLETDASDFGIGAVLMQEGHPLAFFSKKLGPRRRSASTYHKELYAIVEAVQKWRQYLLGREFVIRSDQKSLKELLQQVVQTPEQHLYVRKLMGYKFIIEYKSGAANRVADALSRRDEEAVADGDLLMAAAHPVPDIMTLLREETTTAPDLRELSDRIQSGEAEPRFTFCDGLIYCGRRIYVSATSPLREVLISEHHSTPQAGHPGFERTLRRLAAHFIWPNMKRDVKGFVAACVVCQTTKYSTQKPAGLLQPLPIPTQVWEDVSMDFIVGLPQSKGYTTIMVVVDRLSKYTHFAPLPARFDAMRVARLFIDTVVKHHGFPKTLVSDRDPIFLSETWDDMLTLSGTKLNRSTAYHPQSDGQTEVRNRGLEQYLRAFTADRPSKWANFLPWAELALNCFHHEALGTSPFQALYGREPPPLVAAQPSASRIRVDPTVAELISQRGELLVTLRQNLERAQQRMRDSANKHRRDVHFDVGDKVLLKLQQYRQHSVARPISAKLARRFYGPFVVTEKIGQVAYRLQLPAGARIHDVFHVSLLKPFVEGAASSSIAPFPVKFLGIHIALQNGEAVEQALVEWGDDGLTPATWEPLADISRKFPFLLEDKEPLNGEGVDTGTTPIPPAASTTQEIDNGGEKEVVTEKPDQSSEQSPAAKGPGATRKSTRQSKRPEKYQDYVSR